MLSDRRRPGIRPPWLKVALLAMPGLLVLATLIPVVAGRTTPLDVDTDLRARATAHLVGVDALAIGAVVLPWVLCLLTLAAAGFCAWRGQVRAALHCLAVPLTAVATTTLALKPLVDNRASGEGELFPSSHATAAVAAALALSALLLPGGALSGTARGIRGCVLSVTVLAATAACLGLIVGGYHYPTDVLGGIAVASTTAVLLGGLSAHVPRREGGRAAE